MRLRGLLTFGIFAVVIGLSLTYFRSMGVNWGPPEHRTNLTMEIPDVNGLVVGSRVLLRGVPVGEVTDVSTTVSTASVKFYVDGRYSLPVNSEIRLENLSALGETYIGFIPKDDTGPNLTDGQQIAAEAVEHPPSISEMATTLSRVLNQLDPAALQRVINEADAALPDPVSVLPNLSRASMLLRNAAASMNGQGKALLSNFQSLLRNADFVGPVLAFNAPYLAAFAPYLAFLNGAEIKLWKRVGAEGLNKFDDLIQRVIRFMDHSAGDVKVLTQTMLPYLNDTAAALMNIDTAQIFGNMLDAVPADGTVTVHLTIPPN